jgi:hypothetical protein
VANERDFIGAQCERMAFVMEQNESLDPLHIRLLSTDAVVADPYQLTYLVEQPRRVSILRIRRHKNLLVHSNDLAD